MKRIISFKELYGSEIATYEVDGKHPGDALQNMENKLCNEIELYTPRDALITSLSNFAVPSTQYFILFHVHRLTFG